MKIIFFQNCISPHQMPYIKVLAQRHEVAVVAPVDNPSDRPIMGWEGAVTTGDRKGMTLLIAPTDEQVHELLNEPAKDGGKTVALFSGIHAFKPVQHWLDMSLDYEVRRGIITEAPYTYRIPLLLHKIRFVLQAARYVKYIKYVFAIGYGCEEYYKSRSKSWKVVPFMYCVENDDEEAAETEAKDAQADKLCRICFVGSLDKRKNVMLLLRAFAHLKRKHKDPYKMCELTLIGDGQERERLESFVEEKNMEDKVTFRGTLPMKEARKEIKKHDILVLPSKHDGWGAVVNEALSAGTYVLVSDRCGAASLIGESARGRIFKHNDEEALMRILWNDHGFFLDSARARARREKIRQWAQENIGPEAVAERMENVLMKK